MLCISLFNKALCICGSNLIAQYALEVAEPNFAGNVWFKFFCSFMKCYAIFNNGQEVLDNFVCSDNKYEYFHQVWC